MTMFAGSLTPEHRIGDWIDITPDGRVAVRSGKVELGQGITSALISVVAAELGIDPDRVVSIPPSTRSPDEGVTAGSLSMSMSGTAVRLAARALRRVTATEDGQPVDLARVTSAHREMRVLEVLGEGNRDAGHAGHASSMPRREASRTDLMAKVTGGSAYLHDLRLPGQVFGRVIRRARQRPTSSSADTIVAERLRHPDVLTVVRDGAFLGVIARSEHAAIRAATQIEAGLDWTPIAGDVDRDVSRESGSGAIDREPLHATDLPPGSRRHHLRVTRPHLLHASIGPVCAMARWDDSGTGLEVWTHSQGVHPLRRDLARALDMAASSIHVEHVPGAGCYGHNAADDVAYDAVLLARSMRGVPVHVTWSRSQDFACGPTGPSMEVIVSADTDDRGRILAWDWAGSGEGHVCRPGLVSGIALLAHSEIEDGAPLPASTDPDPSIGGGIIRNSRPLYDLSLRRSESTLRPSRMRTSAIRSLGAYLNVIATENLIDDIARTHGIDPVEFRLAHLRDDRAARVLVRAIDLSGEPGSAEAQGRGIGLARYKGTGAWCAVVADVECIDRVRVHQLVVVADVGEVVSRDGVLHQLEGGALQSLSWTLHECAPISDGRVAAAGWPDYPIARFSDVPAVIADVIDRPGEPFLGAGEAAAGPTGAALTNAVTAALGVRLTDLPLTPESIIRALP